MRREDKIIIIPAIDIKDTKCVRLSQGIMSTAKVYSDNPVDIAKQFEDDGAKIIHLIDLDGAVSGRPVNITTISKIVKSINIPVQLGGGIRNRETIDEMLNLGVERVILGTSLILSSNDFLQKIFSDYGEKIVCGIDAKEGKVAISGWSEVIDISSLSAVQKLQNLGAQRIIYTDIFSDGMLSGPNFKEIKKIIDAVKIPVIASGGISSIVDIFKLKDIGVEGIIIGKAIYEGKINLKRVLEKF